MSEQPWQQLHPASVVVNLLPRTWRFVRSMWPFLLAMAVGGGRSREAVANVILLLLFFAPTVGGTVLHWATLRYRIQNGLLEIQTGLLNRQLRTIDPARVQNVETTQNLLHRWTGLVEVRIETASGTEAEGLLSALTKEDAAELVNALRAGQVSSNPEEAERLVIEHGWRELLMFGATDSRWGSIFLVISLFFEGLPWSGGGQWAATLQGWSWLFLIPGVLAATWAVGVLNAVVRFYGFRLVRTPHGWVAEHGLFTRRRVEIRQGRLQTVTVAQPWLRRWLGFASVELVTAAGQGGGPRFAQTLLPVVPEDQLDGLLNALSVGDGWTDLQLQPPHPRALTRGFVASGVRSTLFALVASYWAWPWGLLVWLWLPASLWFAWMDHRYQGWSVDDRRLVTRKGFLDRRTEWMPRAKVQSSEAAQGPLLARYGLGFLKVRAAGSGVTVPALAWDACVNLGRELSRISRPPLPPPLRVGEVPEAYGTEPPPQTIP